MNEVTRLFRGDVDGLTLDLSGEGKGVVHVQLVRICFDRLLVTVTEKGVEVEQVGFTEDGSLDVHFRDEFGNTALLSFHHLHGGGTGAMCSILPPTEGRTLW